MKRILPFFIIILFALHLPAQNNQFDMDSTVFAYYQKCEKIVRTPQIFTAADTLFQMAGAVGDKRTQAAALCHKANYYYFVDKNMDSLRHYTKVVQRFAKATAQPKYYFWIWGRYITGYILKRQYNLALLELKAMQEEALDENYIDGQLTCYKLMSRIYNEKGNKPLACEYQKKVVELTEEADTEDFNLSLTYATLVGAMLDMQQVDEAVVYQKKALEAVKRPSQLITVKRMEAFLAMDLGNLSRAVEIIKEMEALDAPAKRLAMLDVKAQYARITGDYKTMNVLCDSLYQEGYLDKRRYLYKKANALTNIPGMERKALKYCIQYMHLNDSLQNADSQISLEEFSTIMDVTRLNKENSDLALAISEQKLHSTYGFLVGLGVFILAMSIFTFKVMRLNRRLRRSEANLKEKNTELVEADKVIKKEKERAESASRMKSSFIQNMSHEIRTPLNSIVGFSQVLTDELKGQEDMKMYANIITENSNNLLKLIGDVIELSSLDAMDGEVQKSPVYVNELCSMTADRIKEHLKPGVELVFRPWEDERMILSNPKLIVSVLDNLLLNAAKFTTTGSIVLDCRLADDVHRMEVSVTDTGIGIPKDKAELVFERFTKLDDFTQGTGLGLAISRLAAQHLGGNVVVDSGYKEGCRMLFTFAVE